MKIRKIIPLIFSVTIMMLASCNREPVPPPEPTVDYVTVRQLRAMSDAGITTIDTSIYIQGIITLTPELGNVPSFIAYIQDSTAGICLTVTGTNSFSRDSEVKVLCRGASFTKYNGLLQFGDISIADQTELISLTATPPGPVIVTLDQLLTGAHQAEYVLVENVQFKDQGTFSGTRILTDCSSEVEVYTRSDATFAQETMPTGNGTFKAVASVYTDIQLLLREETELAMTGDRCGGVAKTYLSEDFNTIVKYADASTIAGWKTYPEEGTKTWYGNYVTATERWIQATAYNSGQASVKAWLITPVIDLTTASNPYVSFESANGYDNGATLKLYASADYTGSATPWTSTWTPLTFTLPPLNSGSWSDFVSSGKVDISAYKGGNVYIAWVYEGGTGRTTTWEVDNILVADN